ncbi:MAG: endonuclease III [bacterium]|nr:endonuclease III [bacterium]
MSRLKLEKVIRRLDEYFGKPFDNKANPPEVLDVLIATKLSQNTTDKSSYAAFKNLKAKFPTWELIGSAKLSSIKNCIKVCGLANTKATDIKTMLISMQKSYDDLSFKFLKEYSDKEVYAEFLRYKGIGIKTISCVLIFALGRDAFPVDTHVHRVLNRLGVVKTNSPGKTFELVKDEIPEGKKYELHSNLIKFGRNICRSKNPLCNICFLYDLCTFEEKEFYFAKNSQPGKTFNNFIILEHI